MSSPDEIKTFLAISGAGALLAWGGWKNIKRILRVKNSARQLIIAASAGQVELEAIAWPLKKSVRCLKSHECIYLNLIVEEYRDSGRNKSWETIWAYSFANPFLAFDESGFVRVQPTNDTFIDVSRVRTYEPARMGPQERAAFDQLGCPTDIFGKKSFLGLSFGRQFRIREKKLLLGSPLLIHGSFYPEDKLNYVQVDSYLEDFRDRCMKLLKTPALRKTFLDQNRDGVVTRDELLTGFERTLKLCTGKSAEETLLTTEGNQNFRFYGKVTGTEEAPLHIADTFEEQYLKGKSLFLGWMSFAGGMFLFLFGLYLLGQG